MDTKHYVWRENRSSSPSSPPTSRSVIPSQPYWVQVRINWVLSSANHVAIPIWSPAPGSRHWPRPGGGPNWDGRSVLFCCSPNLYTGSGHSSARSRGGLPKRISGVTEEDIGLNPADPADRAEPSNPRLNTTDPPKDPSRGPTRQ